MVSLGKSGMSEVAGRAFDLLGRVVSNKEPLGLLALASACGVDKTTASRLLRFLEDRELVLRDPSTQRYQVGPAMMILAAAAIGQSDFLMAARPHFPLLRDITGETVSAHLRVGAERVCVGGLESERQIRSAVSSGDRRELFRGASGKTILAYLSGPDLAAVLENAARNGCDVAALTSELRDIRQRGGMGGASDRIPGLTAASVPVFDAMGVVGALTVSGPSHRWSDEQMGKLFPILTQVSSQVSAALGSQISTAMVRDAATARPGRNSRRSGLRRAS